MGNGRQLSANRYRLTFCFKKAHNPTSDMMMIGLTRVCKTILKVQVVSVLPYISGVPIQCVN